MKMSKHAEKRMKARCGFNKKASERMARKALQDGISHSETKGRLNKWVTSQFFYSKRANNIKLYGDKAYIFQDEKLITVIQIPVNLTKDLKVMVKLKTDVSRNTNNLTKT